MARPQKKGLDYFPFDVGFFNDIKIRGLKGHFQSLDGIIVYIYFLCLIYRENGYYMQLDSDTYDIAADDLNMSSDKIGLIISFLCKRSLFDDTLFAADKVLTSRGIQLRFQEAVKSRAAKTEIEVGKYWLLSESETQGYIKRTDFQSYSKKNHCYSEKNDSFSLEKPHKVKESKEKYSKGKGNNSIPAPMKSKVPQDLRDCYQNNISRNFITPIEHDNLEYWCGKVEPDVIKYAIGEAVSHNAANWSYIKRILENHYNAGRTTLDAVKSAKPRRGKDAGMCESSNGMTEDEIEKLIREKM